MIQRTLLRQSRALTSWKQSVPRNLLTGSQFRPGNVAFAQAVRPLAAARFYATEPESKTEGAAAAGNGAQEAEDPLKKQLEAKDKEIIDLKVRPTTSERWFRRLTYHRTGIYAR